MKEEWKEWEVPPTKKELKKDKEKKTWRHQGGCFSYCVLYFITLIDKYSLTQTLI